MPFIGSGPAQTPPVLTPHSFTLSYPYTSPTITLMLRSPEFGNQDSLAFDRISRKTMGNEIVIYADPRWPKQQTLQVTVLALTDVQVRDLLILFKDSLGKDIRFEDWEGRTWKGIITTPEADVTRASNCRNSVSFSFEGELQ